MKTYSINSLVSEDTNEQAFQKWWTSQGKHNAEVRLGGSPDAARLMPEIQRLAEAAFIAGGLAQYPK